MVVDCNFFSSGRWPQFVLHKRQPIFWVNRRQPHFFGKWKMTKQLDSAPPPNKNKEPLHYKLKLLYYFMIITMLLQYLYVVQERNLMHIISMSKLDETKNLAVLIRQKSAKKSSNSKFLAIHILLNKLVTINCISQL